MRFPLVTGALIAGLAAGCQPLPDHNAQALRALKPAAACQASLPFFGHVRFAGDRREDMQFIPADGRIAMRNDGGWCSIRHQFNFMGAFSTPEMTVLDPPQHGQIILGALDGLIVLAYQPAPGFSGTDSFRVRLHSPIPEEIPVSVVVSP